MRADELRPGDVIQMATGRVVAQRIEPSHGGLEVLVLPIAQKAGRKDPEPRVLWWYRQSEVRVLSRGHKVDGSPVSGRAQRIKASQAAAEARKARLA
jgi:hypothetical protein